MKNAAEKMRVSRRDSCRWGTIGGKSPIDFDIPVFTIDDSSRGALAEFRDDTVKRCSLRGNATKRASQAPPSERIPLSLSRDTMRNAWSRSRKLH